MTDYNYSIATDFTSLDVAGVVNLELLREEVADSAIASGLPLLDVKAAGDTVTFVFTGTLTSGDETLLDGIVAAHTGTWPGSQPGEGPPNYFEVSATGNTETTSLTYVDVAGMVITEARKGKWLATFSTTITTQDDNQDMAVTIAVNGSPATPSIRNVTVRHKDINYGMQTQAFLELEDDDVVAVRFKTNVLDRYARCYARNFILTRLE